jgi:hypothetical protein
MIQDSLPADYQIESRIKAVSVFAMIAGGSFFSPSAVSQALGTLSRVYHHEGDEGHEERENMLIPVHVLTRLFALRVLRRFVVNRNILLDGSLGKPRIRLCGRVAF